MKLSICSSVTKTNPVALSALSTHARIAQPVANDGARAAVAVKYATCNLHRPLTTLVKGYSIRDVQILSHFAGVTASDLI